MPAELKLETALKIHGLMPPHEVHALAELASKYKRIFEIGAHLGRSTRAMADNTEGTVVTADDFNGPRDAVIPWKDRHEMYDKFLANMGEYIATKKVIAWKVDHKTMSKGGLAEFLGEEPQFDMVFLDGSHAYEDVRRDLAFGMSILTPGGLLCGHDYTMNSPGVLCALGEIWQQAMDVLPGTTIWVKQL